VQWSDGLGMCAHKCYECDFHAALDKADDILCAAKREVETEHGFYSRATEILLNAANHIHGRESRNKLVRPNQHQRF
jgi:predicted small metal-binding protein